MFFALLSQTRFSRELLLRQEMTVSSIMDPRLVVLDAQMTLSEASALLMEREYRLDHTPITLPEILLCLQQLNQLVYQLTVQEMYATGAALIVDRQALALTVVDFAHGFIWLKRGHSVHRLSPLLKDGGPVPFLGIEEAVRPPTGHFRLRRGDMLLICSDGFVEARDADKQEFTVDGVVQALRPELEGPGEAVDALCRSLEQHRLGARLQDDLSAIAISV